MTDYCFIQNKNSSLNLAVTLYACIFFMINGWTCSEIIANIEHKNNHNEIIAEWDMITLISLIIFLLQHEFRFYFYLHSTWNDNDLQFQLVYISLFNACCAHKCPQPFHAIDFWHSHEVCKDSTSATFTWI